MSGSPFAAPGACTCDLLHTTIGCPIHGEWYVQKKRKEEREALMQNWEIVARALLVKFGGQKGSALVGSDTLRWARDSVDLRVERDGDALRIRWSAAPLTPEDAA